MTLIRTVTLELLRHGPPHNQLLSPLTRYLGLCGDYGAATVCVPYEHREFLSRLKMLRYQNPAFQAARRYNDDNLATEAVSEQGQLIEQTAESMAQILKSIPGLVSELNEGAHVGNLLTHLNLVLSPAELALLPFELSKVPEGCKGGRGNWLALQTHSPVCITRQVRGISDLPQKWAQTPRILFAFAATSDMDALVQAHTTALTQAIRPWMSHFESDNQQAFEKEIDKHLTLLPNASIKGIEAICAEQDYTHVHLLAHGARDKNRPGDRYGINLCRRKGSPGRGAFDTVSGEQLALALGSMRAPCPGNSTRKVLGHPLVVSIASCDSGYHGSVIYDGAAFAHQLHQSGIPFVVASQFPLSFAGSVVMVRELYQKLMCGVDPRMALHALRAKLYARHDPGVHDWAALIAYAALPDDLSSQLVELCYLRARQAIGASMSHVDAGIDAISGGNLNLTDKENDLSDLMTHVDLATRRLPNAPDFLSEAMGLRGTVDKRKAEAYFRLGKVKNEGFGKYHKKCLDLLNSARLHYFDATRDTLMASNKLSRKKRELHWPLTQYLGLSLVIEGQFDQQQWQAAFFSTELELESTSSKTQVWAGWSRMELYLLQGAVTASDAKRKKYQKQALEIATNLSRDAHRYKFPTYSSRRQLQRYVSWWGDKLFLENHPGKIKLARAKQLAEQLIDVIPDVDSV